MMKKTIYSMALLLASMMGLASCGTTGTGLDLGSILGGLANQGTANSLLNMVIGHIKIDQRELIGTWYYQAPGCAFTSEKLLAKAGGAVAAANVKEKLTPAYKSVGIGANNTGLTFTEDNKFSGKIDGLPLSGTYTYDAASGTLKLKMPLMSATGYITRTTSGLALTFESKKLLTVLQTASALSGSSTLQTIGDLSKEFDGARVGFELTK